MKENEKITCLERRLKRELFGGENVEIILKSRF